LWRLVRYSKNIPQRRLKNTSGIPRFFLLLYRALLANEADFSASAKKSYFFHRGVTLLWNVPRGAPSILHAAL
jgi:hypothetical protein